MDKILKTINSNKSGMPFILLELDVEKTLNKRTISILKLKTNKFYHIIVINPYLTILKTKIYKLFADCQLVKGYSRTIICDITRKQFDFIPNALFELLKKGFIDTKDFVNIDIDNKNILSSYIKFLISKDYIFELANISELDLFPKVKLTFELPSFISNAIIDYDGNFNLFKKTILMFEELNTNFILVRVLNKIQINELKNLLNVFEHSIIFSIEIIICNDSNNIQVSAVRELIIAIPRISNITIFNKDVNIVDEDNLNNGMGLIIFSTKKYEKNKILKISNEEYFSINIKLFSESISKNNFFNKKIYVSESGNLKNSPFTEKVFGNIKDLDLKDIISNKKFLELWDVKKDIIDVCKDCEYRYMCVDNRTPIKRKKKNWYFVDECNYNPYINKWFGEKNYMSLVEIGVRSDINGFSLNIDKIEEINQVIWDDA